MSRILVKSLSSEFIFTKCYSSVCLLSSEVKHVLNFVEIISIFSLEKGGAYIGAYMAQSTHYYSH
jgi:hypothetical protein